MISTMSHDLNEEHDQSAGVSIFGCIINILKELFAHNDIKTIPALLGVLYQSIHSYFFLKVV